MDCTTETYIYASAREENLATDLRDKQGYLVMPQAVLKSVGPYGARLMGALMEKRRPGQPDVFCAVEKIATDAFSSVPTTRKLLDRLAGNGWLEYVGRQPSREGVRCRRTATWRITPLSWQDRRPWFPWPKWLGEKRYHSLPPAAHAVYGVILGRWCLIERHEDDEQGGLDGREEMTIRQLQEATGHAYNSIRGAIYALRWLIEDNGDSFDLKVRRASKGGT